MSPPGPNCQIFLSLWRHLCRLSQSLTHSQTHIKLVIRANWQGDAAFFPCTKRIKVWCVCLLYIPYSLKKCPQSRSRHACHVNTLNPHSYMELLRALISTMLGNIHFTYNILQTGLDEILNIMLMNICKKKLTVCNTSFHR